MKTKTLAPKPVLSCVIPDWLQECINSRNNSDNLTSCSLDTALICQAFEFAYKLHEGQYRKSGEPYICHPIAVAGLLKYLGGDSAMIAAGFLHDIVEDTDVTIEEIEQKFGSEIALLVEGVTKLSKFNFSSKTELQAENFRRMFLAMAKDIRVIVVKLADRLHNMRTLQHLPRHKQLSKALETREIFAPLANRLGIGRIKWELEDLSFKYIEPEAYREVQELVADKRADREAKLLEMTEKLRQKLDQAGIECYDISGRPKHLYGIYRKMHFKQKAFHEVYDIAGLRIIVNKREDCYRTLAIVHDSYRPIPGRFKDYIGLPKPNRYQSLHTGVIGNTARPVEVQIRTVEMHHIAEYGIAAHWKYKETSSSNTKMTAEDEKFTWLRQLLEWQSDLIDDREYLETIKGDLFYEDVYVFTPKGDVIPLKQGSTSVDFAYRIHTEVGNHCTGAKVNDRIVSLDTPLKNGDIVEILTQKNGHPSLDWLNFVVTSGARNRIRQWYKRSHREENVSRGKELLEKELGKKGFESLLKSEQMLLVAERFNYHNVEDLLAALGYGEITLNLIVNRLRDATREVTQVEQNSDICAEFFEQKSSLMLPRPTQSSSSDKSHPIAGVEGLMYHLAGCCNPIPGEPIIGSVTRIHGISIHRQGCSNVENVPGERLVPVSWNYTNENQGRPQTYPVNICIEVMDRVGVLKDILSRLMDNNVNVKNAQVKTSPGHPAIINLCIEVSDRQQFEKTCTQIKNMSDILNLRRLSQVE
ncbi:MAG: bifunctional (p)ppGpp synthetase/guanosine-3',5'-bis(diphosphate) 3'-pyrophosphohydrolase [Okeania sp. SIO3B5]|uniref:RelA/SpoT family protein n=1 Tax=Okeania sp. SIO3B5 TaxID=2607811 RepID=UPI00140036DD|nr:bifunctional (p)ppGpp synthetase/guanosine-3',5'-bis(diphosphate) 3'-pyrophosphohydrolase [Okeania sp. SIO3B5]NEO56653.1 bifunctional (p)ppGpp synthetase/guanosine-3',5'-bis(diphosphate) 3'-pyrophosphohydrolase [Okeania sp. SIO3B5]